MKINIKGIFSVTEQINIIRFMQYASNYSEAIISRLKDNSIKVVLKK